MVKMNGKYVHTKCECVYSVTDTNCQLLRGPAPLSPRRSSKSDGNLILFEVTMQRDNCFCAVNSIVSGTKGKKCTWNVCSGVASHGARPPLDVQI